MSVSRTRRSLLTGFAAEAKAPIRPPWSIDEESFVDTCTRCGDCLRVCPQRILTRTGGGFPQVVFASGECTFCGACAEVCQPGAIRRAATGQPWRLRVAVSGACLGARGVECRTCGDWCDTGAIRFPLAARPAPPAIDPQRCTGCGACVGPCPASAISIESEEVIAHA